MNEIEEHRPRGTGFYGGIQGVWNPVYFDILEYLTEHPNQSRLAVANHINKLRRQQGKHGFIFGTISGYLSRLLGDKYVSMTKTRTKDTPGKEEWNITDKGRKALANKDELLRLTRERRKKSLRGGTAS